MRCTHLAMPLTRLDKSRETWSALDRYQSFIKSWRVYLPKCRWGLLFYNYLKERRKMSTLMTQFALTNAINESINDNSVRISGGMLLAMRDELSDEEFSRALYEFSANLVATTADLVTHVFMTEEQILEMIAESKQMEVNAMTAN